MNFFFFNSFSFFLFLRWVAHDLRARGTNSEEISIRDKQFGCRALCSDRRCADVGDACTSIRLLLSLSSNSHTLMEVEAACLRWDTSTLALLPHCPAVELHGENNGEAFENIVEVSGAIILHDRRLAA